jgi:hypothetical protein
MHKSPNCSLYTNSIHLLVEGDAYVPGRDRCRARVTAMSCQENNFERPDEKTETYLRGAAVEQLDALRCDTDKMKIDFTTTLVGKDKTDYSGEKLANLGVTSSCYAVGNDINELTHTIRATCRNNYDFVNEKGERVRDYAKTFTSELRLCDVSDEAVAQAMEDARKVAAHHARLNNGFKVQKDTDLACTFSILPFK